MKIKKILFTLPVLFNFSLFPFAEYFPKELVHRYPQNNHTLLHYYLPLY